MPRPRCVRGADHGDRGGTEASVVAFGEVGEKFTKIAAAGDIECRHNALFAAHSFCHFPDRGLVVRAERHLGHLRLLLLVQRLEPVQGDARVGVARFDGCDDHGRPIARAEVVGQFPDLYINPYPRLLVLPDGTVFAVGLMDGHLGVNRSVHHQDMILEV